MDIIIIIEFVCERMGEEGQGAEEQHQEGEIGVFVHLFSIVLFFFPEFGWNKTPIDVRHALGECILLLRFSYPVIQVYMSCC